MDVWNEAEHWNVGMKFGEEGTMKNVWMGAARVRKVKKKKGMVNIQRWGGWELGQRLDRKTNWNEFSTDCSQTFTRQKKKKQSHTITRKPRRPQCSRFVLLEKKKIKLAKRNHSYTIW